MYDKQVLQAARFAYLAYFNGGLDDAFKEPRKTYDQRFKMPLNYTCIASSEIIGPKDGRFYAYLSLTEQRIIFAFRGTRFALKDMMANREIASGKTPEEILTLAENFIRQILADKQYVNQYSKVSFTGHSLGGYIAQKMAIHIDEDKIDSVFTFDAPGQSDSVHGAEFPKKNCRLFALVTAPNYVNVTGRKFQGLYYLNLHSPGRTSWELSFLKVFLGISSSAAQSSSSASRLSSQVSLML